MEVWDGYELQSSWQDKMVVIWKNRSKSELKLELQGYGQRKGQRQYREV